MTNRERRGGGRDTDRQEKKQVMTNTVHRCRQSKMTKNHIGFYSKVAQVPRRLLFGKSIRIQNGFPTPLYLPPTPHLPSSAPSVDGRTPSICPSITSTQTQIPPFRVATVNIFHLTPAVSRSTSDTDADHRPSITTSNYHGLNRATCITVGRTTIK